MEQSRKTVAVLIPAYRPDKKFSRLLQMLLHQSYPVQQIIVMNTEQSLWNAHGYDDIPGLEVHHVTKEHFDHGGTRKRGMAYVKTEVCICMTQDAVPADAYLVENLVEALYQEQKGQDSCFRAIASAYARQLPDRDCRLIERYTRSFNYPEQSSVKFEEDLPRLGIKTYFCSNVCAAYNMEIYNRLDGFAESTIFNEDMLYAADVIDAGYGIAYAADAKVIHSHNYSCMQQLHRNFDLAVSQAEHPEVFANLPSEGEGIRMVKQTAQWLIQQKKYQLLPELVLQSGFKYLGYQLGKHYEKLPEGAVRWLTMNQAYWDRKGYR